MRVLFLCGRRSSATNAIEAHTERLAAAVADTGAETETVYRDPEGGWTANIVSAAARADAVVLQYQPFLWAPRGIAPWLPRLAGRLRARCQRLALVVHEPYVDFGGPGRSALALLQRGQLAALRVPADVVCASIRPWADELGRWLPRRPTVHLPVGSNLPDRSGQRAAARAELEAEDTFVVAVFGTNHPARLWKLADEALTHIAAVRPAYALALGAGNPFPGRTPPGVAVHRPGLLSAEDVARLLSAADLVLAPFVDGVSTRRGSVMAALQHGVAVLGTEGRLTDPELLTANAPMLVEPTRFVDAAASLAHDDARRDALARRGRELYERRYDWTRIAAGLLEALR